MLIYIYIQFRFANLTVVSTHWEIQSTYFPVPCGGIQKIENFC